jgi:protocatechuate 4,5-dioxygenase alpha chain
MSRYALNKMLRDVNLKSEMREQYFADKAAFAARYALSDEERQAVVSFDVGALYRLGAHGLILRPFTLLHKLPEPEYLKVIRG